jgi:hypothetical protein
VGQEAVAQFFKQWLRRCIMADTLQPAGKAFRANERAGGLIALSSEVDSGSREENASWDGAGASVLIQPEPIGCAVSAHRAQKSSKNT